MKAKATSSKWIVAPMITTLALFIIGCSKQGAEDAGSAMKEAAKDTKEAAADTAGAVGDEVKEAAHAAGDTAKEAAKSAGEAAKEAADTTGEAAEKAVESAGEAAKDVKDKVSEGFSAAAKKAAAALEGVEGGGKLLTGIKDFFSSAEESLKGITDKASAEAAVPKLEELTGSLDGLAESAGKLPEEAKSAVQSVVEKGVAQFKALIDKVYSIDGVEEVIKPKVEEMMNRLKSLTGGDTKS